MARVTHHLVQTLEVVGDDLGHGTERLVLVTVARTVTSLLGRDLTVYLPLQLNQHGSQHPELGAATRHLQQTQDHVFLVLSKDKIVRLEEEALQHTQAATAPRDEVGHIVTSEEGARLGGWQVVHLPQFGQVRRDAGTPSLAPLDILHCALTHPIRVLQ